MNSSTDDMLINDLVSRVRDGDVEAFEPIVRRFERPLRAWLAAHTPPGVDVDEVAQRSFVAAFTRLDDFEAGTNFGAWLFTIARFQLRTETTRLRRVADYHTRYAPDLLQRELDYRCSQPSERWQARLEHLRACLDSLGAQARQVIRWRYEEEIPLEEMAARSGRSVPALKKQLWVLRRELQQCIESRMVAAEGAGS